MGPQARNRWAEGVKHPIGPILDCPKEARDRGMTPSWHGRAKMLKAVLLPRPKSSSLPLPSGPITPARFEVFFTFLPGRRELLANPSACGVGAL